MTREELIQQAEADAIDDLTVCSEETTADIKRLLRPGEIDAFVTLAVLSTQPRFNMSVAECDARVKRYIDAQRVVCAVSQRYIDEQREFAVPRCSFRAGGVSCGAECETSQTCARCGKPLCSGHSDSHSGRCPTFDLIANEGTP